MAEADISELETHRVNSSCGMYRDPEITLTSSRSAESCYWGVVSPYTKMKVEVSGTINDSIATYHVDERFSYLLTSKMTIETPEIRVREKFRGKVKIAWCHNLPHNLTPEASFVFDNGVRMKFDSTYLDMHHQIFEKESHPEWEYLEKWRERQPATTQQVYHPWFYASQPELAWPISGKATHQYKLNLKIADLLRVMVRERLSETGEEVWVPCLDKNISKYLEISDDACLEVPDLWGQYSLIGEEEKTARHTCTTTDDKPITMYYHTIVSADAEQLKQYGQQSYVNLEQKNSRVSSILWAAENMDAKRENNHSNYTTSVDSVYNGWNPISTVSMKYRSGTGDIPRFERMKSVHFTGESISRQFPGKPREAGFHAYSYAWDPNFYDADITQKFDKLQPRLTVWIEDGDPEAAKPELLEDVYGPHFKLRCRLRVVREWKIWYNKDGTVRMTFGQKSSK